MVKNETNESTDQVHQCDCKSLALIDWLRARYVKTSQAKLRSTFKCCYC